MTLHEQRVQWEEESLKTPLPKDIKLKNESLSGVHCLWVYDKDLNDDKVILYLHGGGLTSGSVITHRILGADIAKTTGLPVLLVNYRLLPEHKYPAPLEDALSVYRFLISYKKYNPDKIILGSDSSGGGLALAALVQLKDTGDPLPAKAFMMSGAFDMTLSGESMKTNSKNEPYLSYKGLKDWQENYLDDLESPLLSPLFADLSKLPPLLLLAGGNELWLSDSIRVAQKIQNSGGEVMIKIWDSMWHVWVMDSKLKESKEALLEIRQFITMDNL